MSPLASVRRRGLAASALDRAPSGRTMELLEAYAMLILTFVTVLFFSVYSGTSDTYPTIGNFQAVVGNQAVVAIVALAALIPITCNEWDLSVGACAGVSSIYVASTMSGGTPVALAVALGIGIGLVVGLFNAFVVTTIGVNGIITTLGTATILAGVTQAKTGGVAVVSNIPTSVVEFGSGNWLGVPKVGWLLLVVVLGVYYLLNHTPYGRYLYAIGANQEAARLVGLRTSRLIGWSFLAAGALSGLAGALQVARAGGADPRVGEQFTLPALAAAFLSAAAVRPGRFNVFGTIVAVFFLASLNAGLNLAGVQGYVSDFVNGAALIIGVGLSVYLGRRRQAA